MSTTCTPTSRCTPGRRPRSPGAQPAAPPQRRRRLGARVTARGARCRRRSPRRPAASSAPARRPGHARRAARARRGQDRAELAAVQRGGVRLIIQPEPADVHGRGVLEELFPGRVLAGPGDGAQPPGDGDAGTAVGLQVAREGLDAGTAGREQGQRADATLGRELAQVQRAGLTGQAAVPARNPASASRPDSVNTGWTVTRAAVGLWRSSGTSRNG